MMTAEKRRKSGGKRKGRYTPVGTGKASEPNLRARLRGNTGDGLPRDGDGDGVLLPPVNPHTGKDSTFLPSEPWVDVHFRQVNDVAPDGEPISVRYCDYAAKESPLNGAAQAMVRCARCGKLCPPNALEGGECMDHRPARMQEAYGGSPSAHAIQELQRRNLRMEEPKLPPANTSALRSEIKRFKAGKWKPRTH